MKRPSGFTPQRPSTPEPSQPDSTRQAQQTRQKQTPQKQTRQKQASQKQAGRERDAPTGPVEAIPFAAAPREPRGEPAESALAPESSPGRSPDLREAQKQRKRLERAEVRRFTASARHRRRTWLAVLGGVVGLALLACLLAYTPILSVRTIQIEGAQRVNADAVAADLGSQIGSPFPMVDESAIKAALVSYPLIESYSVEARPPSTLVVRLIERTPVGAVETGDGFDTVDAAGVVVESAVERPGGYPLIAVDGGTEAEGFAPAAAVLRALPGELFTRVDTITATTTDDVRFTLRDEEATVVWGSAEESALKAYTLTALMKAQPGFDEYDVTSPGVAVVR